MLTLKCPLCLKFVSHNEDAIFCNTGNHWIHAKCEKLTTAEFIHLCNESEETEWTCSKCLLKALPFYCSTSKVFDSLFSNKDKLLSKTKLDPSKLNKLFSNSDSDNWKTDLHNSQFENNLTEENLDFIDHNYITSENTLLLVEGMNRRCSLIVMHLNIRSLALDCDKLKILVTSMKNQPHVISLNETWIKDGQLGEFNAFLDYVLVTNCRSKYRGGGVAFYIKKDLSFTIKNSYSKMIEKIFESFFIDISLNNDKLVLFTDHQIRN